MYLTDCLILNSGPIADFELKAPFNSDGTPKPVVLVGSNGSGKTGALSILADALIEVAATAYPNVTQHNEAGRSFFRLLGTRNQRVDASFEASFVRFAHRGVDIFFRSKTGDVRPEFLANRLTNFGPAASWTQTGNEKLAWGPEDQIKDAFSRGAHLFFPSNRYELPHWLNSAALERDPDARFQLQFSHLLPKPIVIETALQELKPWIQNVMLDMTINPMDIINAFNLDILKQQALMVSDYAETYSGLNIIIQSILRNTNVHIARTNRSLAERRICIAFEQRVAIPSLDHLSAGQSTLFSMFGTILRYGDIGQRAIACRDIEGLVIVDEIDAHLHADLQHDALPILIKLFPKIQFIITSNAPLFPLGMQKIFGDDGFAVIEMPTGTTVGAERFSEFEASLAYFRDTRFFEEAVKDEVARTQRPLVMCEGETDPEYLRTAADLLGLSQLAEEVDFDWVGSKLPGGAQGSGKDHLHKARTLLRHNPNLLHRKTVLLYDNDASQPVEDHGPLFVRTLPSNAANRVRKTGIENLLPESVFQSHFYEDKIIKRGDDEGTIRTLKKVELCQYLCQVARDPANFEVFRAPLEELAALLLPRER